MPQITLEYTDNCSDCEGFHDLFYAIHKVLNNVGGIDLNNCKSRALVLSNYYIADGNPTHGMVHLSIRFVEGRSEKVRQGIGAQCLELLKRHFAEDLDRLTLQLTVELGDIQLAHYHKHPPGTLTKQS